MAHYIDKDALVAEIEKRIKSVNSCPFRTAELGSEKLNEGQLNAYNVMLSFIDTVKVKEVDLEKYIENEVKHYGLSLYEASYGTFSASQIDRIIRNAFELGLNAKQG